MPRYKTHLAGGLTTFFLVLPFVTSSYRYHPEDLVIFLLASLLGSLFPDIDIKSKMQNLFYWGATIILLFALLHQAQITFFIITVSCFLVAIIRHRTITHRVWFLILFPSFIGYCITLFHDSRDHLFIPSLCLFFIAGSLSHVFLDKTTTKAKFLFKRSFKR